MHRFSWLDEHDTEIWLTMWAMISWIPARLDEALKANESMNLSDYLALVEIAQADDQKITMSQLAKATQMSASRLSHIVARLERRGLVARSQDSTDRRTNIATLTKDGVEFIVRSTPGYLQKLRELVFDSITPEEADQLNRLMKKIVAKAGPDH